MGDFMNQRKHVTPEQKVLILREHLENQIALSELSEKHQIHINVLYRWKKELFEGASEIFSRKQGKQSAAEAREVERLSAKLRDKDKLIADLVQDNIELKKSLNGDS
jgi:transposase